LHRLCREQKQPGHAEKLDHFSPHPAVLKQTPVRSQQLRISAGNFRPFQHIGDCRPLLELLSTASLSRDLLVRVFGNRLCSQRDDDEEGFK
jgi:hypothetical protein